MFKSNILITKVREKRYHSKKVYTRICNICNNHYETPSKKSRKCTNCWKTGIPADIKKQKIQQKIIKNKSKWKTKTTKVEING